MTREGGVRTMRHLLFDIAINILMALILCFTWNIISTESNLVIIFIISFILTRLIQLFINDYWNYIRCIGNKKEKQEK